MDNSLYEEVAAISASDKIISKNSKTQSLNVLRNRLNDIQKTTTNRGILESIKYDLLIIEDCYKIDMYKFQFKGLLDILQKDIDMVEKAIILENGSL